jgi:glycosyltransferase involved in cell wall biosynthesis
MSKVSICIPTYQQTIYLKRCIESILIQSFKDYEIIISDDTKDDSIATFLKTTYAQLTIQYYKNTPSLGTPANWNKAISMASGTFIKVMHHDDFFTQSHSLEKMIQAMEENKADFLCCDTDVWHIQENEHRVHQIKHKRFHAITANPLKLFFNNWIGAPSATMFRNENHIAYDERFKWLVDLDQYIQILFKRKKAVYIAEPLICTVHGGEGQVTGSIENDKTIQIKEHVLLYNKIINNTSNSHPFEKLFDHLFFKFGISSYQELIKIVPEAKENQVFFENIISGLDKNRTWKYWMKRFYESKYNNYFFKLEQYL